MKKNGLVVLAVLLLNAGLVTAQKTDSVRARASYTYSIVEDLSQPDKPREEQMILLLGKNASVYTSIDKVMEGEKKKKEIEAMSKQLEQGISNNFKMSPGKKVTANDIYMFRNEKKMFVKQRIINNYLTEDPLPVINWKISNDTLTIAGLKCQKATAHVLGRDYEAWFSPDIPFSSGPWKLCGLPGLIVQASDLKKEILFKFDGFETIKPGDLKPQATKANPEPSVPGKMMVIGGYDNVNLLTSALIELPKDAIRSTTKEVENLREAMKKDPAGFINSSMAGQAGNVNVVVRSATPAAGAKPTQVLNTIELPEKK